MSAVLAARGLSAGYGGVPVVTDVDIFVDPGEIVAVLGANGAGKSTTLMALAGRLPPLAGRIEWLDRPVRAPLHSMARRGLRYVPEERGVIRSLSTLDNLRLGPGPVDEALEVFPELKLLLKRPAGLLSGGEQQMIALGRALAGSPTALLVDELSLGLSPMLVRRVADVLVEAARRGLGIVLVEQQVSTALHVAHRGYVLRRGRIELEGDAAGLRDRIDEIEAVYLAGVDWNSGLRPPKVSPQPPDEFTRPVQ